MSNSKKICCSIPAIVALGVWTSHSAQAQSPVVIHSSPQHIGNSQVISKSINLYSIQNAEPKGRPIQHVGSGPIDLNNLPADILNCDVCRQRLGLPSLPSPSNLPSSSPSSPSKVAVPPIITVIGSTSQVEPVVSKAGVVQASASTPSAANPPEASWPAPMLGSPGLISSGTAAKLATDGLVVQEFIPPQPKPGAIQLDGIPYEARQQFLKSLNLPEGSRIMTAVVAGSKPTAESDDYSKIEVPKTDNVLPSSRSLGAPGIISKQPEFLSAEPKQLQAEQLTAPKPESVPSKSAVSMPTPAQVRSVESVAEALPIRELDGQSKAAPKSPVLTPEAEQLEKQKKINEQLRQDLDSLVNAQQRAQAEIERKLQEQTALAANERAEMEAKQQLKQREIDAKLAATENASRQIAKMLEDRTEEVAKLQNELKKKQEEAAAANLKLDALVAEQKKMAAELENSRKTPEVSEKKTSEKKKPKKGSDTKKELDSKKHDDGKKQDEAK